MLANAPNDGDPHSFPQLIAFFGKPRTLELAKVFL